MYLFNKSDEEGDITMQKSILLIVAILSIIISIAYPVSVMAQEKGVKVLVTVDGLSCPFCAFGLEKKLKKLAGVESVTLNVDQGVAEMIFRPSSIIDRNRINKAVVDAGFTPREIQIVEPKIENSAQ